MSRRPGPTVPAFLIGTLLAALLLPAVGVRAQPADTTPGNPLQPIDTSSPRATLQGFIAFTDAAYRQGIGRIQTYLDSRQLGLSDADLAAIELARNRLAAAERALDTSALPPALSGESSRRIAQQLKEVLDRIELPPFEAIPDASAMATAEFKRWTLPGTEIRIARVEHGPRMGEYLFDPETVERIPEFYDRIKDRPYRDGATGGFYETATYSPVGIALALRRIVPPRWILATPRWLQSIRFLDQPLWRWASILLVLGASFAIASFCHRLARRKAARMARIGARWTNLALPFSLVIVTPLAALVLAEIVRISGGVYQWLTLGLWGSFFLALTWLVWGAGGALAETVIGVDKLRESSIDSQLIRLMLRLLTLILAIAILVAGADRVGLPAYSVLAGIGVGGFAVALGAQQTLANLLGSLIIMFEKPFAIGHLIRVQGVEGTVENVGFRSTRIRTLSNSLVTIPSSQMVNGTVDNLELREYRQLRTTLGLTYDTSPAKLREFTQSIEDFLRNHPSVRKSDIQVRFFDFGPHSLDILVNVFLSVPDRRTELKERQGILLEIMERAELLGVRFAFPTQTLHVESFPAITAAGGADGNLVPPTASGRA